MQGDRIKRNRSWYHRSDFWQALCILRSFSAKVIYLFFCHGLWLYLKSSCPTGRTGKLNDLWNLTRQKSYSRNRSVCKLKRTDLFLMRASATVELHQTSDETLRKRLPGPFSCHNRTTFAILYVGVSNGIIHSVGDVASFEWRICHWYAWNVRCR